MLDSTLRPPSSTAAAVSSQEVSMPRTIMRARITGDSGDLRARRRHRSTAVTLDRAGERRDHRAPSRLEPLALTSAAAPRR